MNAPVLEVDPSVFYRAATKCFDIAHDLHREFETSIGKLESCTEMAGSDRSGTTWGSSYDERADELVLSANGIIAALQNYGGVLTTLGHNYETADYQADISPSSAPVAPSIPPARPASTLRSPPSAGGPGAGLIDDMLGLVDQIGVPVPDGDSGKLGIAAGIWHGLDASHTLGSAIAEIDASAGDFVDVCTPDAEFVHEDLTAIRFALTDMQAACRDVGLSCQEYCDGLRDLRSQIVDLLEALAAELAITAAISVAASLVSFGVGAAVGAAKAALTVPRYARKIHDVVVTWAGAKRLELGVKLDRDLAHSGAEMRRIELLGNIPELSAAARQVNAGKWVYQWRMLPKGNSKQSVRLVDSDDELETVFDQWVAGASRIPVTDPKILEAYQLPDGTRIQLRRESDSGGPTIDVFSGKKRFKVHVDGQD